MRKPITLPNTEALRSQELEERLEEARHIMLLMKKAHKEAQGTPAAKAVLRQYMEAQLEYYALAAQRYKTLLGLAEQMNAEADGQPRTLHTINP